MYLRILALSGLFAAATCNNSNSPVTAGSAISVVSELRVATGAIPGWMETRAEYRIFDTTILLDMINGGAPPYIEQGLLLGIYQVFAKDSVLKCMLYLEDFGQPPRARDMMKRMKSIQPMPLTVPGFDSSSAAAKQDLDGSTICASFDRFYIELFFSGYNTDALLSLQDAAAFLTLFRNKIRGTP